MKEKDRLITDTKETIIIKVSKDVKKRLIQLAKEKDMTLSAYLVQKGLNNIK